MSKLKEQLLEREQPHQPLPKLPALQDQAANLLKASEGSEPLLKFRKGKFYHGETEVPAGGEYLAYCADWIRGWTKFVDGEVAEKNIGRVADGFRPVEREELDDRDETKWPEGVDGKPSDPWVLQHYLPLENIETGDRYVFITGSAGGAMAIRGVCSKYARNITRGLPTVKLAVTEFKSKKFGSVTRPDFPVIRWESERDSTVKIVPPHPAFDDSIEF